MRRRPPRRRRRWPATQSSGDSRAVRNERIRRWLEGIAAGVVVLGGLFAAVAFLASRAESLFGDERSGHGRIEVRQTVVLNGLGGGKLIDGSFVQPDEDTPQIDITVRNTGKDPVLLTEARVTIEDSTRLAVCEYHSGDIVTVSKEYAIELPALPLPEEGTVRRALHQEVRPGAVDRFQLLFRLPRNGEDIHIYDLRLELSTDGSQKTVEVGRFLLSLPGVIGRDNGRMLPVTSSFPSSSAGERLASRWCFRRNKAVLDRLLSSPGKRSSMMAAHADLALGKWWPSFAEGQPSPATVEALLRPDVPEGPVLAVFAAESTGEARFAESARVRAAEVLLRNGEAALRDSEEITGPINFLLGAVQSARYSYAFAPSPEARELVLSAEARLQAYEEEQEEREAALRAEFD